MHAHSVVDGTEHPPRAPQVGLSGYRELMVHASGADDADGRLAAAVSLARRFGARLCGVCVDPGLSMPIALDVPMPPSVADQLEAERQEEITAAHRAFLLATEGAGLEVEWKVLRSDLTSALTGAARSQDLVVLGQERPGEGPIVIGGLPDAVAFGCGRPVLVIPYIGVQRPIGHRVTVAWNGSRESTRAVHDALPLLQRAEWVELLVVEQSENAPVMATARTVEAYLQRLGVRVHLRRVTPGTTVTGTVDVGDAVLAAAMDADADLLVMGAYGHSRLREVVLGGVTRHVLAHMPLPVLLAH